MGRWRAFVFLSNIARIPRSSNPNNSSCHLKPFNLRLVPNSANRFFSFRRHSGLPSPSAFYGHEFDYRIHNFGENYALVSEEDVDTEKIPIKAYFLCTRWDKRHDFVKRKGLVSSVDPLPCIHGFRSIDLKSMHAENSRNVVPPTSRSSNYIALRFCNFPSEITGIRNEENVSCCRYMVVFQYGSAVLFNVEDHEVESYLEIVRRHAFGLLPDMRKDDYAVKEKPLLVEDMRGGTDCIVLRNLDTDSIRIIGSVLGQSIALDYFVTQIDGMVEEFTDINRGMEKTGTFTMDRKKLFQLVGKANSNLADVILKVGLFDRSEIAWRDAKYAQIHEYLRDEYEVAQRFGNLDFKLKFVEHNIHFLQEVLQNRRSDLLEWCIIFLLSIENFISVYEIVRGSTAVPM